MLSHQATAQTSDPNSLDSSSQSVDCSDPLLANSTSCGANAPQTQGAGSQNYGQIGAATAGSQQANQSRPQNYNDTFTNTNQNNRPLAEKLPPQPLTEFQKFVAGTTGQVLPVFGANLFQNAPSTFAPTDETPVPPDYVVGPGDLLRVRVWGQVNFTANVRVDRSGEIYIPQVGQTHVAGLPFQALDEHVRQAVARVYRNFDLTVDIGQIRAVQVYVVGQAHRPGTYTVSSLSTLVDVLFASGGPSISGSLRHVYLKRGGKTVVDFDLYDLLVNGDKSKDTKVESGDVIFIPAAGPQVAMTGSVRRPGIYELRDDTSIEQILATAGGASTTAAGARISIERIQEHDVRQAMEVAYDATGLATVLRGGDIVRLLSIVPKYQKTVTLRGNTANPGRFAWHEGMHVSDLIPDRESLLTRDYWWKRTQLGLSAPDYEPVPYLASQNQPTNPVDLRFRTKSLPRRVPYCPTNAQQQNQGQNQSPGQLPTDQSQYQSDDQNSPCVPYVAGTQGANPAPSYDQFLQQGSQPFAGTQGNDLDPLDANNSLDRQSQSNSLNDQRNSEMLTARQTGLATPNSTLTNGQHTSVKLPAPEIDWDYAVIERLDPQTLKTSLISFDLGKLVMQHDSSQDLELQPGDVISVFSQADIHVPIAQQTKFVRLEGEFVHAGVYSVKPGETLRDMAERAGGLTPEAYLYGSQFTRESTRVVQQQRIDEYVQSLELEINRGALAQSSSATASAQDIASATAAVQSEHELINKLQQIRATGRIVLEIRPDSSGVASLPNLSLEDGDRFIVPSRPATVNVVGSVYDQNSFVYRGNARVGEYLHFAGGPNRDADRKHVFVIHADGSVVSRQTTSGVWGNTFDSIQIHPGDTIVMPEKTFRPSGLRNFLEFSQLFSSLAFGAAAIAVIQ